MKKTFHTSLYGHFVLPLDDIILIDTDQANFKMEVHFREGLPTRKLFFNYHCLEELRRDTKAFGTALEAFHKNNDWKETKEEVVVPAPETAQQVLVPENPISDSLEIN